MNTATTILTVLQTLATFTAAADTLRLEVNYPTAPVGVPAMAGQPR
jgi:hypothetical protein